MGSWRPYWPTLKATVELHTPDGHWVMTAIDPDPDATKRNPKRHIVYTSWRCECGEVVTDTMAHRAKYLGGVPS